MERLTGTGNYQKMTDTPNRIELTEQAHLESIRGGGNIPTTTKQTEYLELADREASRNPSRGGYDNKYRKLRGLGAYSQQTNVGEIRRGESEISDNVGNVDEQQGTADRGEYP